MTNTSTSVRRYRPTPHALCPACLRPVIPGRAGNIAQHRDSLQLDACPGAGLPFHTTGTRYTP